MTKMSRRVFLKRSVAVGAGAMLLLYSDGSYRMVMAAGPTAYTLRILHTNDHHARIEPVLNSATPPAPLHGGLSRRKTLIDQARAETPDLLLVDAGDVFQGTLFYNQYHGLADLELYNALKYDVMAVGNHEFDNGQQPLATFIQKASFPVLSANIQADSSSPLAGLIKDHVIVERNGQRIGIFGLTTEETAILSSPGPGVSFSSAIAAAQAQVAQLQAAGVNKIIALTHLGIEVDRQLARSVSGIALIIGGHSHTPMGPMIDPPDATRPYPELIAAPDGKPVVVVTDWEWGRWLGDLTVSFDADGVVTNVVGKPTEVAASVTPDPGFENRIAVFRAPLEQLRATPVGTTAVLLDGARANVRSKETNLGNLVSDAMLEKARPDGAQIAFGNGGNIRTSIPAGPVTVGQVLEVLPFGNTLARVDLTGAQVKEALENGVSLVENLQGRFPQVAGVRFVFNPAAPAGSRVVSIEVANANGFAPIDPAASYRVVTNDFLLSGGDGYAVFTQGRNQLNLGFILADIVADYIAARSPITVTTDGRIAEGTAAAPGTSAPAPSVPAPSTPAPAPATGSPPPVSLPNTGGDSSLVWMLASLGASALGGGLALRRRALRTSVPDTLSEPDHSAEVVAE